MAFADIFRPVLEKGPLSTSQVEDLTEFLVSESSPAQIGATLVALTVRGISGKELAVMVRVLRSRMVRLPIDGAGLVDTCGTGGGSSSFNISTAAALVAAAAGAKVAKHGNRAVTSTCGSADVLETLGIALHGDPVKAARALDTHGFAFLMGPKFHPALAHVGPTRKELGFRTVFNVMGPMLNPAGAESQLMGVFEKAWISTIAEAFAELGTKRALVVHGTAPRIKATMDEISPLGPTDVAIIQNSEIRREKWTPATFGLKPTKAANLLPGDSLKANADILIEAVTSANSPRSEVILPSAAAAIWLAGLADTLPQAAELARETIRSGKVGEKISALQGDQA